MNGNKTKDNFVQKRLVMFDTLRRSANCIVFKKYV